MKFWSEFKKFALKGNVFDMAVGVIIGTAFGKIVTSVVSDLIMPAVGALTGGSDISDLKIILTAASGDIPENAIRYGAFIQNVIDFFIIALCIFLMVRAANRLRSLREKPTEKKEEEKKPTTEELLGEIRDILKKEHDSNDKD